MKKILLVLATVFLLFGVIGAVQAGLPPVADVKGPYLAGVSDLIVFDGSGSYDPDGFSMQYEWDFGDGSPPVVGTDLKSPTHSYTSNGVYTVTLTVTDMDGMSDTDTARVDITDPEAIVVAYKWSDDNGNGVQDAGEIDIAGWLIEVYMSEDSEVTWTKVAEGLTGSDGSVTFDGLPVPAVPTFYRIVEEQRPGWTNTTDRIFTAPMLEYSTLVVYFGNMYVPTPVIPEVPWGTVIASAAMIIALVAYVAMPKFRKKQISINP